MIEITEKDYNNLHKDYRDELSIDHIYEGKNYKGAKTMLSFVKGEGTCLLVEGISFIIRQKIYHVKLTKNDSCLTYALKRTGRFIPGKEYSLINYLEYFNEKIIENKKELSIGDIVLWNKRKYLQEFPTEIDINGVIINNNIVRNMHVAVIEKIENENIYISDCIINKENHGIPCVYNRLLSKRFPDSILKIKN